MPEGTRKGLCSARKLKSLIAPRAENANYVNAAAIRNDIPLQDFSKAYIFSLHKILLFALLFPNTVFIYVFERDELSHLNRPDDHLTCLLENLLVRHAGVLSLHTRRYDIVIPIEQDSQGQQGWVLIRSRVAEDCAM